MRLAANRDYVHAVFLLRTPVFPREAPALPARPYAMISSGDQRRSLYHKATPVDRSLEARISLEKSSYADRVLLIFRALIDPYVLIHAFSILLRITVHRHSILCI